MALANQQEQKPIRMSETEYLEFEEQSEIRHEYSRGMVYAMAGAEWEHTLIAQSASATLYAQLRGTKCKLPTNDLRLKVTSKKVAYRYPDFMVVCGEPRFVEDRKIIDNPTLVAEVLSPSTALEDRNAKLREYTAIPSVQVYMLISQDEARIEAFSRFETDKWLYSSTSGLDARIELPSINCTLALADVYEQVNFDIERDSTEDNGN